MIISLRPATPADDEFCYVLHQAALGEYVAEIWGWDDQAQREYHRRAFAPGQWMIITADGEDAGMIAINQRAQALYRRLGFEESYRHGDDNLKIRMRYAARP